MENEAKKASKVWLVPTIIAAVLLVALIAFMLILGKGTKAVSDGTQTLAESVAPLKDGTAQLSDGVDQYTEGVDTIHKAMPTLTDGVQQYTEGVDTLNGYMKTLNAAAPTLASGVQQLYDGAVQLNNGINGEGANLSNGMQALANGVAQLDTTLAAGLTEEQQADMKATVKKSIEDSFADKNNKTGTAAIKKTATEQLTQQLDAGKPAAKKELLGNKDFTGIVGAGVKAQVEATVRPQVEAGVVATINADNSPLKDLGLTDIHSVEQNWENNYGGNIGGRTLGQAVAGNVNPQWATYTYSEFMDAMVAATIDTNAEALNSGVDVFADTVASGVIDGVADMAVPMLADTIAAATLRGALGAGESVSITVANQTMGTIRQSMIDKGLFEGVATLNAGVNGEGTNLSNGMAALTAGLQTLNSSVNGKNGLVSSVAKLYKDGSAKLAENSQALRDGVKQLADGAKKLSENSKALRDGASQLKEAAPALIDGIGQLKDGAKQVNGFTPVH